MTKKVLSVFLCVLMLFSVLAVSAFASDDVICFDEVTVEGVHTCPGKTLKFPGYENRGVEVIDEYILVKVTSVDEESGEETSTFVHLHKDFAFDESYNGKTVKFAVEYKNGDETAVAYSQEMPLSVYHVAVEPYHTDSGYHWNVCSICGDAFDKELHSYDMITDGDGNETLSDTCKVCGEKHSEATSKSFSIISNVINTIAIVLQFIIGLFGGSGD